METSEQNRGGFEYHISPDMIPPLLEAKIETCIASYKREHFISPNLVILPQKMRDALLNSRSLETPSFISGVLGRERFVGEDFMLHVYDIDELPQAKRLEVEKIFSENSEALYIGRTALLGLGKKISGSSLVFYNLQASSGDLMQT